MRALDLSIPITNVICDVVSNMLIYRWKASATTSVKPVTTLFPGSHPPTIYLLSLKAGQHMWNTH